MSKPTNFIEIGMPLVDWQDIRKKLLELDIDPEQFQKCRNYGKLRYDIVKVKFGYWKKEKLIPENYMK
ncbi:hypothetical protein A2U04_10760 [Fusobacterium necrophorum subsp. funduliforme]|uniref:hypothetical protein n=1 Tax=Fusobacterium necrophorum TaxID=859 RepID=UPI000786D618|nr:hypothetical protein [Fusobacterium necrophorum]KYM51804.1 hypothetical protein A2U04_10760 [Fusobacterium necrophorum subsp. funduliforme]